MLLSRTSGDPTPLQMLPQVHLDELKYEVERTLRAADIQQLDLVNGSLCSVGCARNRVARSSNNFNCDQLRSECDI